MEQTPYERGYQAGVCHLPHDDAEEEAYYASLSQDEQQAYDRGWLDGYVGQERNRHDKQKEESM